MKDIAEINTPYEPPYFRYFPWFQGTREAEIRRPDHAASALFS